MRTVAALLWRKSFVFPLGVWLLAILFSPIMNRLLNWSVAFAFPPTIYDLATIYPWSLRRVLVLAGGLSIVLAGLVDWRLAVLNAPGGFKGANLQREQSTSRFIPLIAQIAKVMGQAPALPTQILFALELALDISFIAALASYQHGVFVASVDSLIGLNPMVLVEPIFLAASCAFAFCIILNAHPWTSALAIRIMGSHRPAGSLQKSRWVLASDCLVIPLVRVAIFALVVGLVDSAAVNPQRTVNPQLFFMLVLGVGALASMVPYLPTHLFSSRQPQ